MPCLWFTAVWSFARGSGGFAIVSPRDFCALDPARLDFV